LLLTTTAIPGLHKLMGIADERVKDVRIQNDMLSVDLLDGRTILNLFSPSLFIAGYLSIHMATFVTSNLNK
jgi:hypothetical protein